MMIAAKGTGMSSDEHEELEDEVAAAPDDWEEFRDGGGDGDPLGIEHSGGIIAGQLLPRHNPHATVAVHFMMHYHLIRVHKSPRTTPAMAAG
jgi:hypothetical protein